MSDSRTTIRPLAIAPRWALWRRSLALAAVFVAWPIMVSAHPSPAVKKACGAELRAMCLRPWRLTPESIASCAEENRAQLSPACQAFWDTTRTCQLEIKTVCGGLFPLTIKRCLADSRDRFSQTCREAFDKE
jgi:hypothetical protein